MGALSIRGVRKSFGPQEILKGIDIEVDSGEFLILVGPSGCGKSTLLNLVAGLDSVTSGDILIGGRRVNDLSPKDRDIAMVFQSYALYPNMSVWQNIAFGLEMRGVPREEQRRTVDRVAQILQIEPLLDRRPAQLSGGQRQRVAMGRAIARDPALFLFDEPLSNLDAKLRVEMRTEIKLLHQRVGKTIVYVTHDQIEAMTLGDKIAVMRAGELQQLGTPQEVYDDPRNRFVAGFMGSPSMNFIPCDLLREGGRLAIALELGGTRRLLPLTHAAPDPARWEGKQVILGLRPEKITQRVEYLAATGHCHVLPAPILVSEPTGPDTLLLVKANGVDVCCRVHPDDARRPGESMELMFDLSKAVFFDPAGEARIA
jgi:multiple sugar transport system ATP-binding protein